MKIKIILHCSGMVMFAILLSGYNTTQETTGEKACLDCHGQKMEEKLKKKYVHYPFEQKECESCHGKKGKGDGPKAAEYDKATPDMTKEKLQNQTDGEMFWKITEGKKPMPSSKKTLTEEQRWQVINYVRTLKKK